MDAEHWKKHDMIPFDRNEKAFDAYCTKYIEVTADPIEELQALKETFDVSSPEWNALAKVLIKLNGHHKYCKANLKIKL